MKIKLGEKYYLNSDQYCYWITEEVQPSAKSKTQNVYERRCSGYTDTFEEAVDSFIEKKILALEVTSYTKLVSEINKLKREVRRWKVDLEGVK